MMVFCDEKLARISRKQSLRKNKPVYTFVCAIAVYINYSLIRSFAPRDGGTFESFNGNPLELRQIDVNWIFNATRARLKCKWN